MRTTRACLSALPLVDVVVGGHKLYAVLRPKGWEQSRVPSRRGDDPTRAEDVKRQRINLRTTIDRWSERVGERAESNGRWRRRQRSRVSGDSRSHRVASSGNDASSADARTRINCMSTDAGNCNNRWRVLTAHSGAGCRHQADGPSLFHKQRSSAIWTPGRLIEIRALTETARPG